MFHHLLLLFRGHHLNMGQLAGHFATQFVQQRLKKPERLRFEFIQGITLGIAPEADNRSQVIQRQQMFPPMLIDGLEQHLFFDVAHGLGPEIGCLFRHVFIRRLIKTLAHDIIINAIFFGPLHHRHVNAQILDHLAIKRLGIPLIGIGALGHMFIDQIIDHLMAHVGGHVREVGGFHDLAALFKDRLALLVHHIIVFQKVLPNIEIARLDLGLRPFQRLVHPGMDDGFALFHAELLQHLVEPVRAKDPHQIVFEREEEIRPPGVTLTPGSPAKLIVDPAAFVAFGRQYKQTAGFFDLVLVFPDRGFDLVADHLFRFRIRLVGSFQHLGNQHLGIPAKLNIGAAPGHVGGDGHRPRHTGLGDDLGLLFVIAGVQDTVFDPFGLEHLGQHFGFFNRGCPNQNRL